jgi:ankyrin repeat protein
MEVLLAKAGGAKQAQAMVNAVEARTGKTALHYAAESDRCAMMELLLKQGAGTSCCRLRACDVSYLDSGLWW